MAENNQRRPDVDLTEESSAVEKEGAEPQVGRGLRSVFEWLDSIVFSLIVVVMIFTFFFGKVEVEGESMMNTLIDKDQLIISNFNYEPQNGDIVIISRNASNIEESTAETQIQKPLVKRVIARGGQTIKIEDEKVYVDGEVIEEDYIRTPTDNRGFEGEHTVPEGCIFVMGDNRNESHDSRSPDIGFVDKRYVLGKVLLRVYPFDTFKSFK